jgi:hypothetical protein
MLVDDLDSTHHTLIVASDTCFQLHLPKSATSKGPFQFPFFCPRYSPASPGRLDEGMYSCSIAELYVELRVQHEIKRRRHGYESETFLSLVPENNARS